MKTGLCTIAFRDLPFDQVLDLAGTLLPTDPFPVEDDDSGRVISSVFEATQPIDQDRKGLFGTDVSDNATHVGRILAQRSTAALFFRQPFLRIPSSSHPICENPAQ